MPPPSFKWTDQALRILRRMWVDEIASSSDIASVLGISRNAVLGKVHRWGLSRQPKDGKAKRDKPQAHIRTARDPPRSFTHQRRVSVAARHLTLIELRYDSCRWPLGGMWDEPEFFCGEPTQPGCSFCVEHRQRAFTRAWVRRDGDTKPELVLREWRR